ncbi:MAG: hypothetical protein FGF52_03920 [Candidatus Brockarchaeota archaeon]|nr:hypothetical protein [Candidatus Brockarchaeota archaeon]
MRKDERHSDEELINYISRRRAVNGYDGNVRRSFHARKSFLEDLGMPRSLLLFLLFIVLMFMSAHFFPFFVR